jgi:hypothetical protein
VPADVPCIFFQHPIPDPPLNKEVIHINESLIGILLAINGVVIPFFERMLVYKPEGKSLVSHFISNKHFPLHYYII